MINKLAEDVVATLSARGMRLSVAESCTGGLLSAAITSIPGASACFWGGIVAYHNDVKHALLGVPYELLEHHGAVSQAVALAMAEGAVAAAKSDVAVSTTGIAGPGGGSKEKPVGTVWFGWNNGCQQGAQCHVFSGNRAEVQQQAVQQALKILLEIVV